MSKVLVIASTVRSHLDETIWEVLGAAREILPEAPVAAACLGPDAGEVANAVRAAFDTIHVFADERLDDPGGEGWVHALLGLLERESYDTVLLAHSNLALDLAPVLAARANMVLATDVLGAKSSDGALEVVRAVYGGKLHARVRLDPSHGVVLTLRAGSFAAVAAQGGAGRVVEEALDPGVRLRRRLLRTLESEPGEVDISQATILVGVGRGIEDEENLEIVQKLATALGGEVACSRPVVDKGWLPKSRQVGTSGVTVRPKLYVAVGISGSFQHVGGIKGSPYLVAINKDPKAPIFGAADVGIVGDLFEVVPALEAKIRASKA